MLLHPSIGPQAPASRSHHVPWPAAQSRKTASQVCDMLRLGGKKDFVVSLQDAMVVNTM